MPLPLSLCPAGLRRIIQTTTCRLLKTVRRVSCFNGFDCAAKVYALFPHSGICCGLNTSSQNPLSVLQVKKESLNLRPVQVFMTLICWQQRCNFSGFWLYSNKKRRSPGLVLSVQGNLLALVHNRERQGVTWRKGVFSVAKWNEGSYFTGLLQFFSKGFLF